MSDITVLTEAAELIWQAKTMMDNNIEAWDRDIKNLCSDADDLCDKFNEVIEKKELLAVKS